MQGKTAALVATTCLLCLPLLATAQDDGDLAAELGRLSIHGFLTQGYGQSDGHQVLGINEDGTSDYRTAALQVRYDHDSANAFVVQLSHESVGDSPANDAREDVELDWVFYQHQFARGTQVKVGRVPIPIGIYNEIRDVGTLLPFYRPPDPVYTDTGTASETIDGIVVSHRFGQSSRWSLDVEPFAGQWELGTSNQLVRNAVGVQVWLNTPIDGLRIGAERTSLELTFGEGAQAQTQRVENWEAHLDGRFRRFVVQGEYQDRPFEGGFARAYYGLLGFKPTERLGFYAQYAKSWFAFTIPGVGQLELDPFNEDAAVSINWAFRPDLVLKLEHHRVEGFVAEDVQPGPGPPVPTETDYSLISLSASF